MNKELARKIFEAGENYGAEKYGSSAGHFDLKLETPDFEEWWQSQLSEAREAPKLPANETLDLMMRVNNAEKKANNHFDNLMEYMRIVEEVIGFAGPFERVREELLKLKKNPEAREAPTDEEISTAADKYWPTKGSGSQIDFIAGAKFVTDFLSTQNPEEGKEPDNTLNCNCTSDRQTPMINGRHICSICNKPLY